MDWDAIRVSIECYIQNEWMETPIAWENLPYRPVQGRAWIRTKILKAGSQRETLTGDRATGHRCYGTLMISIFTPANSGAGLAGRLMDQLVALFREKELPVEEGGVVRFEGKSDSFETEEPDWYQLNWSIPFSGEEA